MLIDDSRKKSDSKLNSPSGLKPNVVGNEKPVHLIHDARKKGVANWPLSKRLILFYHNNKKSIKKLFYILILISIVFFPVWSGTLIGTWIMNFFGTIIHIVKMI